MATQTGSFDFKAAKLAKDSAEATASADATSKANQAEANAKKVATNFLSQDSSGVMVYDGSSGTQTPSSPSANTKNVLIDSNGMYVRNGSTNLASFTGSSAQIGKSNTTHTVVDSAGMRTYASDGTSLISDLGYGEGASESGTAVAPYYTLGSRASGSTIGNWSVAEGYDTTASGADSHAEGDHTTASGFNSHAEGDEATASGQGSHAEGGHTTASGNYTHAEGFRTTASGTYYGAHAEGNYTTASGDYGAHAEGNRTEASGDYSHSEGDYSKASGLSAHAEGTHSEANGKWSHSQNRYTIANGEDQTALGKFNIADTTSAVIIGNGTSHSRSNALTVDWNGNVNIASGAKYKINGTNLSASDVGALPLSGGTMTGQIKTSFKESVATGSYGSAQNTVDGLVGEVRFSSGCMGSASIGTAYTKGSITIPTGWYNYIYSPHRSGGANGSASGDNCNYGNLLLMGMTVSGAYLIRVSSSSISEVKMLGSDYVRTTFTPTSGSSYSSYGGCYYEKYGRTVHVHVGVSGLTTGTATTIFTLPSGYRPSSMIFGHGTGGAWNNIGYLEVNTSGAVTVRSQGTYCGADVTFMV